MSSLAQASTSTVMAETTSTPKFTDKHAIERAKQVLTCCSAGQNQKALDGAMHALLNAVEEAGPHADLAAGYAYRIGSVESPVGRVRLGKGVQERYGRLLRQVIGGAKRRPRVN